MVLADFSKAFDTVCFKTVIRKMFHLGFSRCCLTWLSNDLSNRRHFVQINDKKSSPAITEFGISQGSILGPMLFNLYVADLPNILPPEVQNYQYSDDITLYSSCCVSSITFQAITLNTSRYLVQRFQPCT